MFLNGDLPFSAIKNGAAQANLEFSLTLCSLPSFFLQFIKQKSLRHVSFRSVSRNRLGYVLSPVLPLVQPAKWYTTASFGNFSWWCDDQLPSKQDFPEPVNIIVNNTFTWHQNNGNQFCQWPSNNSPKKKNVQNHLEACFTLTSRRSVLW